jgi:hypothetical protein
VQGGCCCHDFCAGMIDGLLCLQAAPQRPMRYTLALSLTRDRTTTTSSSVQRGWRFSTWGACLHMAHVC